LIKNSELVLNEDKSIYHLKLKPEEIADLIFVVGDQSRVQQVSKYFDSIELKVSNREFNTHTGYIGKKRVSVTSTGIGTDNIDIVLNELDALANLDLESREIKKDHKQLDIIRIGTSGGIQKDIDIDSIIASSHGLGLDNLMHFYSDNNLNNEINQHLLNYLDWPKELSNPYIYQASKTLLSKFDKLRKGITVTSPGFYAPQGRKIRAPFSIKDLHDQLSNYKYENLSICNFEMETSALYGLGKLLGHNCLTVCCVLANRQTKEYSKNPKQTIEKTIKTVLDHIT
jgi:uridine phosphorylase